MSLPPKAFYSFTEACARWGCAAADLAGWAATDHLTLVTSIAAVTCGKQPVAGIVAVPAADMMAMFRRHGPSEEECRVFRIRPQGSKDWQYITEPACGIVVKITDILLLAEDVHRFEEERELPIQGIVRHDSRAATIRTRLLFVTNLGPYARQTGQTPRPVRADVFAKIAQIVMQLAPLGRFLRNRLPGNGYP